MKRAIIIYGLVGILLTAPSCNKFLTEEMRSDVSSATYYTTKDGFEDAVKSTYSALKEFWAQEMGSHMTVFGTDVHTNGADGSHKGINQYDSRYNPQESYFRNTWNLFYWGINQANAVLNRGQAIQGIDPAHLNKRFGEVRFLRALYYFTLVRFYGDVHFSLEETIGVETTANKTARLTIYDDGIIKDLEFAIANLPVSPDQYGRVTKPAAEMLLGKVLLHRGWLSGDAADFNRSASLMETVINDYSFRLLPDFADIWALDNDVNDEVVWAIQNDGSPIYESRNINDGFRNPVGDRDMTGRDGNRMHLYFLMEYDKEPGMTRDVDNGRPWKRFKPTPYHLSLWKRDIDSRYDKSYKHVWYVNKPTGNLQMGDTALYLPGPQVEMNITWADVLAKEYRIYGSKEHYESMLPDIEAYLIAQGRATDETEKAKVIGEEGYVIYFDNLYPTLNKWIDPTRPDRQWEEGKRDWFLLRLADAYLIAAEAYFKVGNNVKAAEMINAIRTRAAWPGKEAAMQITSADVDLNLILEERALELDGEMQRWFDLTRTGTLVERVKAYNAEGAANIKDYHVLRPIPQDQIDRTEGGYEQNDGY